MNTLDKEVSRESGFSVVELLIVLAVVAVLGVAGFFVLGHNRQAHAAGWTSIATPTYDLGKYSRHATVKGCRTHISGKNFITLVMTRPSGSYDTRPASWTAEYSTTYVSTTKSYLWGPAYRSSTWSSTSTTIPTTSTIHVTAPDTSAKLFISLETSGHIYYEYNPGFSIATLTTCSLSV